MDEAVKKEWHAPVVVVLDIKQTMLNCGSRDGDELSEDYFLTN